MSIKIKTEEIVAHMEQVCTALLEQAAYQELRGMLERFSEDRAAIEQYEQFAQKQDTLQYKEDQGEMISEDEIKEYEEEELALYNNDTIREFLYAQEQFSKIHSLINQYIIKTIELGRLPQPRDIKFNSSCGCGGNCGS